MSLLGIDVGTSGCKTAAFSETGQCLASAYREYTVLHPRPGWAELESQEVWNCVRSTIAEVAAAVKHDPIRALAVSSLGEAMAPVSNDRQILGRSITSLDTRGREYAESIALQIPFKRNPSFGDLFHAVFPEDAMDVAEKRAFRPLIPYFFGNYAPDDFVPARLDEAIRLIFVTGYGRLLQLLAKHGQPPIAPPPP